MTGCEQEPNVSDSDFGEDFNLSDVEPGNHGLELSDMEFGDHGLSLSDLGLDDTLNGQIAAVGGVDHSIPMMSESVTGHRNASKRTAHESTPDTPALPLQPLQQQHTTKSTDVDPANVLWYQRFQAFRARTVETRDRDLSETIPNCEDIRNFMGDLLSHIDPQCEYVPKRRWMTAGVARLQKSLKLHYSEFQLPSLEQERIAARVEELCSSGKLTRKEKRADDWIRLRAIRTLIESVYRVALDKGCLNWDVPLANVCYVLLLSATARSCVGTVNTSLGLHNIAAELPCLFYNDITIKMVGSSHEVDDLVMFVSLRSDTDGESDASKSQSIVINPSRRPGTALLCPVKIVLVQALRHGLVNATNVTDLLHRTAERSDRTVQWKNPNYPLFSVIRSRQGTFLDRRAVRCRVHSFLASVAVEAGFMPREALHNPSLVESHTATEQQLGTGEGSASDDPCAVVYMNAASTNAPFEARRGAAGELDTEGESRLHAAIVDGNPDVSNTSIDETLVARLAEATIGIVTDPSSNANEDDLSAILDALIIGYLDTLGRADANLQPLPSNILKGIEGIAFVDTFSTINTSTFQGTNSRGGKTLSIFLTGLNGNSRDAATQFQRQCKNTIFGCTFTHGLVCKVRSHEVVCKLVDERSQLKALLAKSEPRPFPCESCSMRFVSQSKLDSHVREVHEFDPVPCPHGCKPDKLYKKKDTLRAHLRQVHSGFRAAACPVSGCGSDRTFSNAQSMRLHIKSIHSIEKKDMDALIAGTQKHDRGESMN